MLDFNRNLIRPTITLVHLQACYEGHLGNAMLYIFLHVSPLVSAAHIPLHIMRAARYRLDAEPSHSYYLVVYAKMLHRTSMKSLHVHCGLLAASWGAGLHCVLEYETTIQSFVSISCSARSYESKFKTSQYLLA